MRWRISLALVLALALGLLTTLFAQDARRPAERDKAAFLDTASRARGTRDRLESIVSRAPREASVGTGFRSEWIANQILEDPVLSRDPRVREMAWGLTTRAAVDRINARSGVDGPERLRELQEELRALRDRKPAPGGGSR